MNIQGSGLMTGLALGALLWAGASRAADTATGTYVGAYLLSWGGQEVAIPFHKVDGVLVNDRCLRAPVCQALEKLNGTHPRVEMSMSHFGTPASAYGDHLGGVPMVLRDKNLNETRFCAFGDRSLISSWDLYGRYQGAVGAC